MKHIKKTMSVLLSLVIMLCLLPAGLVSANGTETIGDYTFETDDQGRLIIGSEEDWNKLSDCVRAKNTCEGYTFIQTADISVSRPVGGWVATDSKNQKRYFSGSYDGGNHTLTVNYDAANRTYFNNNVEKGGRLSNYCSPFPYAGAVSGGVTFSNLKVEGTITIGKKHKYAAGLIGAFFNGGTIDNVEVGVTIDSATSGDGTHGGIISIVESNILQNDTANNYVKENGEKKTFETTVSNCTFNGKLLGSTTINCGGFIGYAKSVIHFDNCLFDPQELTIGTSGGATFTRFANADSSNNTTYDDCYYTDKLGSVSSNEEVVKVSETMPDDGNLYESIDVNGTIVYKQKATDPQFKGYSVVLTGSVGMVFYVQIPDEVDKTQCNMTFAISGKGDVSSSAVALNENLTMTDPDTGDTYYGFTCNVNVLQMADTITATLHLPGDATYTDEYSVSDYIEYIVKNPDKFGGASSKTVTLVKALADYGHYVQAFLSDIRGFGLGSGDDKYAKMDTFYKEMSSSDISSAVSAVDAYAIEKYGNENIEKITFSLAFESDSSIYVYFKLKSDYTGEFSATVGGSAVTPVAKNGKKLVTIPGIPATAFATPYTIEFTTTAGTSTVTVSALSYVYALFSAYPDNTAARQAAAATYYFYSAASNY